MENDEIKEMVKKMGMMHDSSKITDSDTTTFRFTCDMCGQCCKDIDIMVNPYDALKIRRQLKLNPKEFFDKMTFHIGHSSKLPIVMIQTRPRCVFIQDNKCGIHLARPTNCRGYPCGRLQTMDKDKNHITKWIVHRSCSKLDPRRQKLWKIKDWMKSEGLHEYWDNTKAWYTWVEKWTSELMQKVPEDKMNEVANVILKCWYGYPLDLIQPLDDAQSFKAISSAADVMIDAYIKGGCSNGKSE
jgi:Fe-S-cluster containining protein